MSVTIGAIDDCDASFGLAISLTTVGHNGYVYLKYAVINDIAATSPFLVNITMNHDDFWVFEPVNILYK
jgi:hypothetical protein